jgi:superfamily II DNA or RNA helicase
LVDFHLRDGIKLFTGQQEIYDNAEDNIIINAGCAFGKTFTGLALVEKFGQKTLIIVHTLKLMEQWVIEIDKVLGLTPGILGNGQFNIKPDICVGTSQTISKKKDNKLFSEFGTVIVDEAHHIPATTFNSIVDKFRARYKIGLTATVKRKDNKEFLITNYITHENVVKPALHNSLKPTIIAIKSDIILPSANSWAARVTKLTENPDYISLIYSIVKAQTKKGHQVLTLANRVSFLQKLHSITKDSGLIIGGSETESVKNGIYDKTLSSLYASMQIFSEGISINPLSCLILGTPISSDIILEQIIGRVIRKYEDKKDPVVIDIILKGQTGYSQWRTREKYYMEKNYEIITV